MAACTDARRGPYARAWRLWVLARQRWHECGDPLATFRDARRMEVQNLNDLKAYRVLSLISRISGVQEELSRLCVTIKIRRVTIKIRRPMER